MKLLLTGMEWFPECKDGGLDRYFYEQLHAFSQRESFSGRAVVSACDPSEVGKFHVRPMARKNAPWQQRWSGVRVQARAEFAQGIDLVNAHFALYTWPYLQSIPKSVPLVVNFQGPWADEIRQESGSMKRRIVARAAKLIEKSVYRQADRIITLSAAFRKIVCERYGVPESRVQVVPGALHLDRYLRAPGRNEARAILGLPVERPILVSVRRLCRRVGLEPLIEAMDQVRKAHPEVLLLIGGKGALRAELQDRIYQLKLEENVRLLGFVSEQDLPNLYAAADVSVVPTVALEGFGLCTVESLAAGTPVLGTRVGATPEILGTLAPDLLIDQPSSGVIARKIKKALSGEIKLPNAEECRRHALQYDWRAVVPKILEVYQEALAEKRATRR